MNSLLPRDRRTKEEGATRKNLVKMLGNTLIPRDEVLAQLPLFLDGPTLSRILFMDELYQMMLPVHGSIMEFGVRWGRDLALWTQLRGIYEPFNWNRHIVGFDTWEGYPSVDEKDEEYAKEGDWTVTEGYQEKLDNLLTLHEGLNPVSHLCKFSLVCGDASETLPAYLEANPHTVVAMAYFDMDIYQPTKDCLEAILPRLTRGSVLGFDELNCREDPGETLAVMEVLGLNSLAFQHSHFSRGNCYAVV